MFSVGRAFQSRFFSRQLLAHNTCGHRFGLGVARYRSKVALKDTDADVEPIENVDMGVNTLPTVNKSPKAGIKYQFTHQSLPEETMYIFDGTAMLFASYFMSAAANANFNATAKGNETVPTPSAVLSHDLNARIVSTMSDDQIREMIATFDKMDKIKSTTAPHIDNSMNDSAARVAGAAEVTPEDRASLQLRCEPLVTMLMQFARLVRDIKPKYVAVAFDAGRKTFRKDLYPEYKLQRTQVKKFRIPACHVPKGLFVFFPSYPPPPPLLLASSHSCSPFRCYVDPSHSGTAVPSHDPRAGGRGLRVSGRSRVSLLFPL